MNLLVVCCSEVLLHEGPANLLERTLNDLHALEHLLLFKSHTGNLNRQRETVHSFGVIQGEDIAFCFIEARIRL